MARRGTAKSPPDLLSRRGASAGVDAETDRGWVARILAALFGFGGVLLLTTLLLEGAPGRESDSLAMVAGAALAIAVFIVLAARRLPTWFLRSAPAVGTILVALGIWFAGSEASAAYAMYLAWVVIAAAIFLDTRLILAHGALAVGTYAFVLSKLEDTDGLDALRITMMAGTVMGIAIVMGGIAGRLREVLRQLEAAARTDPLTGLSNRRALEEAFDVEIARARRGGFEVGVVMLDLDGFKRFNDQHGHQAGDSALKRLSQVLSGATRAIDRVGRIGGEEFAIVAPDSGIAGTLALAERLRRAIEVEFSALGGLTASAGVASYPDNGGDRHALIGAADRALYKAKALGRNRAVAASVSGPRRPGATSS